MSKWNEIHNTNFDDFERCYTIDAWLTDDENEDGKVIAKVYEDGTKGTIYLDEDAKSDPYAQDMIDEVIMMLEGGLIADQAGAIRRNAARHDGRKGEKCAR